MIDFYKNLVLSVSQGGKERKGEGGKREREGRGGIEKAREKWNRVERGV